MGILEQINIKAEDRTRIMLEQATLIENRGIEHDSFAGGDRQLSLSSGEAYDIVSSTDGFCAKFSANLITRGIDYDMLSVGDRLYIGDAEIVISRAGKKCFAECPRYSSPQTCRFYKSCAFAEVVRGGSIRCSDEIRLSKCE